MALADTARPDRGVESARGGAPRWDPLAAARRARGDHLVRGSAVVLAGVLLGAATGAIYWLLAARLYPSADVGRASALFTSVLFVNYATSMGLPIAAAAFAGDGSHRAKVLYSWALLYTSATSVVGSLLYLWLVAPDAAGALWAWSRPGGLLLFIAIVAGASFAVLNDVRFMAARRWGWVLFRMAAVGVVRIPLVWVDGGRHESLWLFLLSIVPPAASGYIGLAFLPKLDGRRFALWPLPPEMRAAFRYASVNYLGLLTAQAATFALPVLVLLHVDATDNARFFVAWSIASVLFLLPQTVGQVLLVEGARSGADVAHKARVAMLLSAAIMGTALAATVVAGPLLGVLYGADYASAQAILRPLIAAGLPAAVSMMALNEARVRHDHAATVIITTVLGVAILVPALVLVPRSGIDGATVAWFAGHVLAGSVAAVLVRVRRAGSWSQAPAEPDLATAVGAVAIEPVAAG